MTSGTTHHRASGLSDGAQPSALQRLQPLLPLLAEQAGWSEQHLQPSPTAMRALAAAGLLRVLAPRSYGGDEVSLVDFLQLIEAVSAVDGSAGWTFMTLNEEVEIASAYLPAASMETFLAERPDVIVAGSGGAQGKARAVEGGWMITGRWRFVTGSPAADYLVVCAVIDVPQRPRPLCFALLPREHAAVLDTWKVDGLRGTGSNDVALTDCFVPEHLCGCVPNGLHTVPDAPLYRLHPGLRFPFPKVAVAAGIARAAIETFAELAAGKLQLLSREPIRERPFSADAMAEAVALRASGWSYAHELLAAVWEHALEGRRVPRELHAQARLACAYSVRNSVRAVEVVCSAAGTSANFVDSPLSRHFRDVHAVPQHFTVSPYHMTTAGRVLLGLRSEDPAF